MVTPEFCCSPLSRNRAHLGVVANWFLQQWNVPLQQTIDELSATPNDVPTPVTAVHADEVIGVLTFKVYPVESVSERALWVNSLHVREELRGTGLGSELLIRGMDHAQWSGAERLYVYTDIPNFYVAHGWRIFRPENKDGMWVLEYVWS